jgi:RNA polymerase sigma factor (sigma-70 family)
MGKGALNAVVEYVWKLTSGPERSPSSDGQLLDRFLQNRDEAAFAALVQRHGQMVLSVCRNLLQDFHDAEDAFQATFLVLALKAKNIRKRASVGSWLYGVACRIAARARSRAGRRREHSQELIDMAAPESSQEVDAELRKVLCEEIDRLPEAFREAIVLCHFEGQTLEEAARQLGRPKGTVASRLVRGRERLRLRLIHRGATLSGAVLAGGLPSSVASATVSTALTSKTVQAAVVIVAGPVAAATVVAPPVAALTEGALKAMFLAKLKMTAAVMVILVAGVAGAAGYFTRPAQSDLSPENPRVAPGAPHADLKKENPATDRPEPPGDKEKVERAARELEKVFLAEKWKKAQEMTDALLAADRDFAARVLAIVLKNQRIKARSHIIAAIQRVRLKQAVPTLIELLEDPDMGTRSWSAMALDTLGDRTAVPALERRLRAEPKRGARHGLRLALAQLGRPYLKYFIDGLSDRDEKRQRDCLGALGELGDKRAVPFLVKLLDSQETWTPMHAADTITRITGIPNATVTKTFTNPDGSVSQQGFRRPPNDFKNDCDQWLARHRREVNRPLDKPAEPWRYTPEPFLPGLKVSFAMNAKQVLQVYREAKLECRHSPEKRWMNQGTAFYSPEEITASRSCLPSLNEGLVSIRYVFKAGRLDRIDIDRVGHGDAVIEPLKKPLELRRQKDWTWTGLGGTITVGPGGPANAERETFSIGLNFNKE